MILAVILGESCNGHSSLELVPPYFYSDISIVFFFVKTFWRSELQSELERNINETHHLEAMRKNLERAIAETEGPMRVNSECIYHRFSQYIL